MLTNPKITNSHFFYLPYLDEDFIFDLTFYNLPRERDSKAEWCTAIKSIAPAHIKIFNLDRSLFSSHELLPGDHIKIQMDNIPEGHNLADYRSTNICRLISLDTENSFAQDAILTIRSRKLQTNQGVVLIDPFPGDSSSAKGSLLVLAHKIICREDLECNLFACCPIGLLESRDTSVSYHWNILNCRGNIIAKGNIESKLGNYICININSLIQPMYFNQLLTLKMVSNYKKQVVFTVLSNDKTVAVEHSLSPHYYLGDNELLNDARKYAFGFN